MTQVKQGGVPEQDAAPFDNSRAALVFALNAHLVSLPQPYMSRAMSDVPVKRRKSKNAALQALRDAEETATAARRLKFSLKPGAWPTKGLDGAHLAGYILQKFDTCCQTHRVVLIGRLTKPAQPCTCGNACCSGWLPVGQWVAAVDELCEIVKNQALVLANAGRIPGAPMKVGLSTQPDLRRQIIKDWFTSNGTRAADLARRFQLSALTVATHRGWITEWLDTQENNAWLDVDSLFDRCGITGPAE